MAVSSVGSTSSLMSSNRMNISGLASGMNTDEIIQGMTIGTRTKIQQLQMNKTMINWKMDSFRNITDKLVSLSSKYTSFLSTSNLMSSKFYAKSQVAAQGANASKVSVSGVGHDNIEIAGIKQLATNASMTTSGQISNSQISTGDISFDSKETSLLAGGHLDIKYGGTNISLTLSADKDYSSAEEIAKSLNELLEAEGTISGDIKLSDKMVFTAVGDKVQLGFVNSSDGNNIEITGGSAAVLKGLDMAKGDKASNADGQTAVIESKEVLKADNLVESKSFDKLTEGKTLTFMLDGTRKTITLSGDSTDLGTLKTELEEKLKAAYGANKIIVGEDSGKLTFGLAGTDSTSILKLTEGDKELVGATGVFGNIAGSSNRINLNAKLSEAGFSGLDLDGVAKETKDGKEYYKMKINGVDIEGITADTTVKDLMDKINASDAGVKISYMEMADKFSITSTVDGAAGKIEFDEVDGDVSKNLATQLFGDNTGVTDGQDAKLTIKYKGSNELIEITRSSNSIDLEGMTVNLKGTFGTYDANNKLTSTEEAITFNAQADTSKIMDTIKDFVKDYNEMLELVHKELSTQRPKDNGRTFDPLTDEQREAMSDKEIERWEEKAKEGLLYNAPELRSLVSDLRFLFGTEGAAIGLKVSSNYRDNGKLELDENALKEALDVNPDKVQDFFARAASGNDKGGAMYRMKETLDKYAKTEGANKGILVQKAGYKNSPTSMLDNVFARELKQLDKTIARFQMTLKSQEDRYYKQFTSLETFIQRMNIQSGYLMQQFGGDM